MTCVIWMGSVHPQPLHHPGGCSPFIKCLGKKQMWVQNVCSVTPEVDRKYAGNTKKRWFLKVLNALSYINRVIIRNIRPCAAVLRGELGEGHNIGELLTKQDST